MHIVPPDDALPVDVGPERPDVGAVRVRARVEPPAVPLELGRGAQGQAEPGTGDHVCSRTLLA